MALTKKTLGRTGLSVTQLGYGAMEVRGSRIWGGRPVTEEQADTILNAVLDAGINFIDTSPTITGAARSSSASISASGAANIFWRRNAAAPSFTRTRTRTTRPMSGRARICFAACTKAWSA